MRAEQEEVFTLRADSPDAELSSTLQIEKVDMHEQDKILVVCEEKKLDEPEEVEGDRLDEPEEITIVCEYNHDVLEEIPVCEEDMSDKPAVTMPFTDEDDILHRPESPDSVAECQVVDISEAAGDLNKELLPFHQDFSEDADVELGEDLRAEQEDVFTLRADSPDAELSSTEQIEKVDMHEPVSYTHLTLPTMAVV